MTLLSSIEERAENFVARNPKFREIADQVFAGLSSRGYISVADALLASDLLFQKLSSHHEAVGIQCRKPSPEGMRQLMGASGRSSQFNEQEFRDFYAKVVIYAAKSTADGFVRSYGIGIVAGIFSVIAVKGAVRAVPLVGFVSSPFLALLPTILIGPALGVAATYLVKRDGLAALRARLFGSDPKQPGQFKKG